MVAVRRETQEEEVKPVVAEGVVLRVQAEQAETTVGVVARVVTEALALAEQEQPTI